MLNSFAIHWNEEELYEYVIPLITKGWNVGYEYRNEIQAKSTIEKLNPDAILIYLKVSYSRGLITAKIIRKTDSIKHIPIIFVDGKSKDVKKVKIEFPNAIYATSETLEKVLSELV
jgi:DNA-binding response OmpR family regulator